MKRKLRIGVPAVALGAALVAAGVLLAVRPWEGEEATGQTTDYRTCNLVYQLPPEDSEFGIVPIAMEPFNDGKPSLIAGMKFPRVSADPNSGEVTTEKPSAFVDAQTGTVLSKETFTPADEAALDELLATIRLDPFDPATAPWPYSDATTSPVRREKVPPNGGIEIRLPDPGSGLVISYGSGDRGSDFVNVASCKSRISIELESGAVLKQNIHPDDAAAFETFREQVELKGLER